MMRHHVYRNAIAGRLGPIGIAFYLMLAGAPQDACADVVVLANRTGIPMPLQISTKSAPSRAITLPEGDSLPIFVDGSASVAFASHGQAKRYALTPNSAYFFGRAQDGRVDLQMIGLGEDETTARGRTLPGAARRISSATIPVKILVDEEEPARRTYWERRLRHRIEAASKVLDKHCRIRLKVVEVDTWNSDNATNDFFQSLAEFEREVNPSPARLAIGFTSQFQVLRGRVHMAGTRGPLHSHILLREFSPKISEPERLEFLVHELGHYLGASHSPERTSVMRPVLGDDLAGRSDFELRFDPVNTLTMSILGEEIRRRNIRKLADMTAGSKRRLRQIYGHLAVTLPDDPAGAHFIRLMDAATAATAAASGSTANNAASLVEGTKYVLKQLARAAQANQARSLNALEAQDSSNTVATKESTPQQRDDNLAHHVGDALMQFYVRKAATAAQALPDEVGRKAFLLALGIALDDTGALVVVPQTAAIVRSVESPVERATRIGSMGEPTMHGRSDLAKHFAVSACLAAAIGSDGAKLAGVTKEMLDAQGPSGFSFADMAANEAGITFADGVTSGRFTMPMIAGSFTVPLVMPEVDDLPDGLSAKQLAAEYGGKADRRFRQQLLNIQRRVRRLPPYRVVTGLPTR
jgi:hypothetical protein